MQPGLGTGWGPGCRKSRAPPFLRRVGLTPQAFGTPGAGSCWLEEWGAATVMRPRPRGSPFPEESPGPLP